MTNATRDIIERCAAWAVSSTPVRGRIPKLANLAMPDPNSPYYDFLWELVGQLHPERIVELGTDRGVATTFLSFGARTYDPPGEVVTVDVNLQALAAERFRGQPNILAIQKHSHWVPRVIPIGGGWIDLLFVDSDHSYAHVSVEMEEWGRMLSPKAVVCYDDIDLDADMVRLWSEVPEPKLSLPQLHHTGFGVAWREP